VHSANDVIPKALHRHLVPVRTLAPEGSIAGIQASVWLARSNWRIAGSGFGIHWPDVDEDLSTDGLLRGLPAPGAPRTVIS